MSCVVFIYEDVPKSFRTDRVERELQMGQLSATRCNCIAILWVSLVSFAAITLCVASQRVFIVVISLSTQYGNFWIHTRKMEPFSQTFDKSRPEDKGTPINAVNSAACHRCSYTVADM
jgi:hypothetical protein